MDRASGYVLNVSSRRRRELLEALELDEKAAEAVPEFSHSRNAPLICFIGFEPGAITHLGMGRRGARAGTRLRRLNVKDVIALPTAISHDSIVNTVSSKMRQHVAERLARGGPLAQKSFESVLEAVRQFSPAARPILDRYSTQRRRLLNRLPLAVRTGLAYQKESVATALSIAGIDRDNLQQWEPPRDVPDSFLDGLPAARAREDAIVIGDLMTVPGFELVRRMPYGAAVFQREQVRLTVIVANHLPLEQQLGADLIYCNETYRSFVIVQYKAMEKRGREAFFRIPDAQLTKEIQRMDATIEALGNCDDNPSARGFRMNENPFFIKFCPRVIFDPDNVGLVKGMYIPLNLLRLLESDDGTLGPRGGRSINFRNVGRYFDNTAFIQLVADAWVGTNISQTELLERIIRDVVAEGRALTIAIKTELRDGAPGVGDDVLEDDDLELE